MVACSSPGSSRHGNRPWHKARPDSGVVPLPYKMAQRIRNDLIGNAQAIQAEQFTFLPSYVQHILEADPTVIATLRIDPSHRFANLFTCPSSSRAAWKHLRPFIALDAAFTKVTHHYVLLVAAGQDANQETVALAWSIALAESFDHWDGSLATLTPPLTGSTGRRQSS